MRRCSVPPVLRDQRQGQDAEGRRGGLLFGEEAAQRAAGKAHDFQRALDALGVAGFEARRRLRIECRQFGMQGRPAARGGFGIDSGAQRGVGLRQVGQSFAQSLDVEHGAAHQQRDAACRGDVLHLAQRIGAKLGGRVALFRRDQVDQPVRKARQCRRVGFGGADVHVAEHLRRIDADDIAGEVRRQFESQCGLS
jgi:hypothetical protein